MRPARTITLAVAAVCAASSLARADGLTDSLPPPLAAQGCPPADEVSLAHAADAVRAAYLPLKPLVRDNIAGVTLHDDPRAIEVVRRSLGEKPPTGWSNAFRCTNSICALQAALGGGAGSLEGALWMLEIGSRGPVASIDQAPWSDGKLSLWSAGELRTIANTLRELPGKLVAEATNFRAFRRVPDGDGLPANSNALSERSEARLDGGGSIALRDSVWKMDPETRREVIAHELGHHIDYAAERTAKRRYALSHGQEWLSIGGWSKSGDMQAPNGFHRSVKGEEAWTAGSWPSEEFANSIAEYRYQGRLFRALAPRGFAYAARYYQGDYLKSPADPLLDKLIAEAGGRIALFAGCGAMVQHAQVKPDGGAAHLALVHKKANGHTETANWDRWSYVAKSPCVPIALAELEKLPDWNETTCRREADETWVRLAERLQEVEAGIDEAAHAINAAGANSAATIARGQAGRLFAEFSPGVSGAAAEKQTDALAQTILRSTP